jgi:flagellar L-ring protein precursor FlgH
MRTPAAPAEDRRTPNRLHGGAVLALAATAALQLAGCTSMLTTDPMVERPLVAAPTPKPPNVERVNNGAIFQVGMPMRFSFDDRAKPRRIGDMVKVDISESMVGSNKVTTDTSRDNKVASKGPGTSESGIGLLKGLLNLNVTASGSDAYKGSGTTANDTSFTGQLAASVINVLPNGNLLIAGERSVALNGGLTTLRFSGIVDPKDLKAGNVVASADVVNAKLEVAGRGDINDAASRSWLQRVLTNSLSIW